MRHRARFCQSGAVTGSDYVRQERKREEGQLKSLDRLDRHSPPCQRRTGKHSQLSLSAQALNYMIDIALNAEFSLAVSDAR